MCDYYGTIDRDPSLIDVGDPDMGNPPNEDSPNELIAMAWVAQMRTDAGLPTDDNSQSLMRQVIDKLEDMASRASGEEQEDLGVLADRLDEMTLSGDTSDLLAVTEAFFLKYAEDCGVTVLE